MHATHSTLYASQTAACGRGLYEINGRIPRGDASAPHTIYTDAMLYSPHVTVFRNEDDSALLSTPYEVTITSAPALNAGATISNFDKQGVPAGKLWALIDAALTRRLERVLALSAQEGIQHLVLGAYGCGVFRNRVNVCIEAYKGLLCTNGPYANVFHHVVLAVYAPKPDDIIYLQFKNSF